MEMKTTYKDLYHKHLVDNKDVEMMKLWGKIDKHEFNYLAEHHPDIAQMFLEKRLGTMESHKWHNYVTEKEAVHIMSKMNPAAKWTIAEVKAATASLGVPDEKEPYFNCYALAVTMNMIMSDHAKSLNEAFPDKTALVTFVYKQAVEKLQDADRPRFLREYYEDELGY